MEKIITIILVLVISGFIRAQWFPEGLMPVSVMDCQFVNQENGWAVGVYGKIVKTTTGGSSWFNQNSGTTLTLLAVHFVDELTGWAAGETGSILKTTDGGESWLQQSSGTTYSIYDIFFLNKFTGFAVSCCGTLIKTSDGGETWNMLVTGTTYYFKTIWFTDELNGVVAGYNKIYRTTDSGESWSLIFQQDGYDFQKVAFQDSIGIIVGGWAGEIVRSTDFGSTWTDIPTGEGQEFLHISSYDKNLWTAVGNGGIYSSTNAGINWQRKIDDGGVRFFHSSAFRDSLNGFAFGRERQWNVMYKTTNGGNTWFKSVATFTNNTLNAVSYAAGLAVGNNGTILKSSGESLWLNINSGTEQNLYSFDLFDGITGNAVGDSGIVLRTTDSGNSWVTQNSGTTKSLNSVSMTQDGTSGYAVGDNGTVIKTTNGGASWINLSSGITDNLYSVYFTDPMQGAACGANGIIIKTTDAGISWISVSPVFNVRLNCIVFDKTYYSIGWAVGEDQTVLKTTDFGSSWIIKQSGGIFDLYGIAMGTLNEIYIAMNNGKILKTINGGNTWSTQETLLSYIVKAVDVSPYNSKHAITVGESGMMFKTTNGGEIPPIVPVELTLFTALSKGSIVTLSWSTATEVNNRGFEVERKSHNSWRTIGFVEGHGTTAEIQSYSFIDDLSEAGSESAAFYRLKQFDFDGSYEYSSEVQVTFAADYSLSQNYPNPFNPSTTINYSVPVNSNVTIKIFNTLGQQISSLVNEEKPAGRYEVVWNAEGLPSGIYFYTIQAEGFAETRKMLLLK